MKYLLVSTLLVMAMATVSGYGFARSVSDLLSSSRGRARGTSGDVNRLGLGGKATKLLDLIGKNRLSHSSFVKHFSQENELKSIQESRQDPFSSLLLHGAPMETNQGVPSHDPLAPTTPFMWNSCGPPRQIMDVKALYVRPEPLLFPGNITFSFHILFHDDITREDNVTVAMEVFANSGQAWAKIPCFGPFGSCTYLDFCQTIDSNTCPQAFKGVPCKCPFKKGDYAVSSFTFPVGIDFMPANDYRAILRVSSANKGPVACYQAFATVG